jgi:hypothetical protein
MPGGRKPKYELNENIEYEGKRSNYRYGKCIKCERIVQAQNWHLHLHEDWLTYIQLKRNQTCLMELEDICAYAVQNEG